MIDWESCSCAVTQGTFSIDDVHCDGKRQVRHSASEYMRDTLQTMLKLFAELCWSSAGECWGKVVATSKH